MVIVCQQPNYFPWLGYLEQCARADVLVVLDSVQWIRQGRQHRVRIRPHQSSKADFQWLTVPVLGHGHRDKSLREVAVSGGRVWPRAHWATLKAVYGRRPFFKSQLEPLVRPWLEDRAPKLATLCEVALESMRLCLEALALGPELAFSSELPEKGVKSERLISLCRTFEADTYYSGLGSTRYLDVAAFRASGIRVIWQHWKHPEYPQGGAGRFKSHLSVLDALANVDLAEMRRWLEPSQWGPFGSEER